jgi:hypothetical protein
MDSPVAIEDAANSCNILSSIDTPVIVPSWLTSSYLKLSYFIGITYKGGSYVVPTPNCCNIFL